MAQNRCDVKAWRGQEHCPGQPAKTVVSDGERLFLCERCCLNVLQGAYGVELQALAKHAEQVREPDAKKAA